LTAQIGQILVFSLTAALNPTLLAATTVMLALDNPKKLLLGYLCGALMTSITLGLIIVFALGGSSSGTSTAKHTINPIIDIVIATLILATAFVIGTGRDHRRQARKAAKAEKNKDKAPPKWKQALSGGSARTTFLIGAVLTLPGASYLAGLDQITKQGFSDTVSVLVVIGFNLVMLILLEAPLLGYAISPARTAAAVQRFNAWLERDSGKVAMTLAIVLGVLLMGRGVLGIIHGS
jgi:glycerol uptake facilitator-like aquaporin